MPAGQQTAVDTDRYDVRNCGSLVKPRRLLRGQALFSVYLMNCGLLGGEVLLSHPYSVLPQVCENRLLGEDRLHPAIFLCSMVT